MKIITELTLDLSRQGVQASVPISQHDAGARRIIFHLRNGGKPIKLEANDTAVLYIAGDRFEPLTVYTENGAYPNSIVYDIAPNASSQAGAFLAQIQIYQAAENITFTPEFMLLVSEDKTNGSHVLESPQYAAVIKAQLAAAASASDAEAAAERAKEAAESVNEAFIRYSADADPNGAEFTETRSEGQDYIGFATGQTAPTEKDSYEWVKVLDSEHSGINSELLSMLKQTFGFSDTAAEPNKNSINISSMGKIDISTEFDTIDIARDGEDKIKLSSSENYWHSSNNIHIGAGTASSSEDATLTLEAMNKATLSNYTSGLGVSVTRDSFLFEDMGNMENVEFSIYELQALKSVGDIDSALDAILAIQESLMGVSE